jgi:hypothetical protein
MIAINRATDPIRPQYDAPMEKDIGGHDMNLSKGDKLLERRILAELLNGRQYGKELTDAEKKEIKEKGLVVVFGASDDLLEFEGAICDELSAYGGIDVFLNQEGIIKNKCDNDRCPYFLEQRSDATKKIVAVWNVDGYSWIIKTTIDHDEFEIFEDGEKYCKGIVFSINDL